MYLGDLLHGGLLIQAALKYYPDFPSCPHDEQPAVTTRRDAQRIWLKAGVSGERFGAACGDDSRMPKVHARVGSAGDTTDRLSTRESRVHSMCG